MEAFRKYIEQRVPLFLADWEIIERYCHRYQLPAGTTILTEGDICRHRYFWNRGLVHFFYWIDGQDRSKYFTPAPRLFTSQQSFSRQQPGPSALGRNSGACCQGVVHAVEECAQAR